MTDRLSNFILDVENIPASIHNLIPLASTGYKHWYKRYTATGILLEGETELRTAYATMKAGLNTTLTAKESKELDEKFKQLMARRSEVIKDGKLKKDGCKTFKMQARAFGLLVQTSSDFGERRNHTRRVNEALKRSQLGHEHVDSSDFAGGDTCSDKNCGLSHVCIHLPGIEARGKVPVPGYLFVEDRPELDTTRNRNPFTDSRAAYPESPLGYPESPFASSSKPIPFKPLVLKGKSRTF